MLTPEQRARIAEIRERHDAATAGPWRWQGNMTGHQIELRSVSPDAWNDRVMTFSRWGFSSAVPTFIDHAHGVIEKATHWFIHPEAHNPWRVRGIDHPDAILIERSSEDIGDLLAMIGELDAERKQ